MDDVKRYDCTNGGAKYCQGCYQMSEHPEGDYVLAEDYDALRLERERPVNRAVVRDVFLRNGFTIKEGHSDLKPYVYEAVEELLQLDGRSLTDDCSAPKWIACADSLPPVNENVLVTCEFTTNDWRTKVGGVDERGNWWVFGASWTPSHWQPLPNPPAA